MKQSDAEKLSKLYESIQNDSEYGDEFNSERYPLSNRIEPTVVEFLQQNFKPDQYPDQVILMKFSDALRDIRSGPDGPKMSYVEQAALNFLGYELGHSFMDFVRNKIRDSMRYIKVKKS
jgi:hypothetical protein